MPSPRTETKALTVGPQLATIEQKVQANSSTLLRVKSLKITDQAGWSMADALLNRVADQRKEIDADIKSILDPLNTVRTAALAFKKKLDAPWEDAERLLRQAMGAFKDEEARLLREAQRVKDEQDRKLAAEEEAQRRKIAAAKTEPMRQKLSNQLLDIEEKRDKAFTAPLPVTPVAASGSTTRIIKKWRITDEGAFRRAVTTGVLPKEALMVNESQMNEWFKSGSNAFDRWPGIEVYEETQIVRTGRGYGA